MDSAETAKKVQRQLKAGIVLSYLLIGINVVSGFVFVPLMIRSVGQGNYDLYVAANSLVSMFAIDLGLGTAVTKFISKYRVVSNQDQIDRLISTIRNCFLFLTGILVCLFIGLYFSLGLIHRSLNGESLNALRNVFLLLSVQVAFTFPFVGLNGVLVAYDKTFYLKIADIVSKLIFIVALALVIRFEMGLLFMTGCFVLHGVAGTLLKIVFVHKCTPVRVFTNWKVQGDKGLYKQVLTFAIWAAINSYGRVLIISAVPTILGLHMRTNEATVFAIAAQVESYVSLLATTFGAIFYPSVSRVLLEGGEVTEENKERFAAFHITVARVQIIILAIMSVGLVLFGHQFLNSWIGGDQTTSFFCMLCVCLPALFFYPLQTAENGMAAIEKIKYCAFATLIAVAVGLISAYIFAGFLGSLGAAIGVCIGFALRTILFYILFAKFLSIRPVTFLAKAYASFVVPSAIAVLVGLACNSLFPAQTWATLLLKAGITSLAYFACVCLFGLNASERNSINGFLVSLKNKAYKVIRRCGL